MEYPIDVSIIIVSYNTKDLLYKCIDSIYKCNSLINFEIIVIDNQSQDGSGNMVSTNFPLVNLFELNENLGFAKGNNIGILKSIGKYIFLLNSDTMAQEKSIDILFNFLETNPKIAAAGPMLLNEDLSLQRNWFNFPTVLKTFLNLISVSEIIIWISKKIQLQRYFSVSGPAFLISDIVYPRKVDYLTLAALMIQRQKILKYGLLDENIFFYQEDCELGFRVKKNFDSIYYVPESKIIHFGGKSSSKRLLLTYNQYFRNLVYVFRKHKSKISLYCLKFFISFGMAIKSFLWIFGVGRSIKLYGVYVTSKTKIETSNINSWQSLKLYISIMYNCYKW